jgi:hypothetical protein
VSRINELVLAAVDACNANCRPHRDRAMIRLRLAAEAIGHQEEAEREKLIRDLVAFVTDYQDDDIDAKILAERCKETGL